MMKHRKIRNSILSTVMALTLLISAIFGLGIGTAAQVTVSDWDATYEVIRNEDTTASSNYFNAENLGEIVNDFKLYAWDTTSTTDSTLYYSAPLVLRNAYKDGMAVTSGVRQYAGTSANYKNAGYLDLQNASSTRPVAMTHQQAFSASDEFLMEMDVVISAAWNTVKGIMIAPVGEFALVNDETNAVADKGIFISLLRGGAGIGGTVDSSTAASLSSITPTTSGTGGVYNDPPMKYEESKVGFGGLYTWAKDSSMLPVNGGTGNMIVTYCVQVQDGVISLWEKNNPTKVLAVELSDAYTGGQISFVSTSQTYGAFVGMRLKKLVKQTEWNYAVQQNTGDTNYTVEDFADIATDFQLYNWNKAASGGNVEYYAPTLTAGFPKAVDAGTVQVTPFYSEADSSTNQAARNFGYLDISSVASGTVSAMTHQQVLEKTDEFLVEMDFLVSNTSSSPAKGLMIAPAGEFALSNDGNPDNEKGVFISFDTYGTITVAGAVDVDRIVTTDNATVRGWNQQPFTNASDVFRSPAWFTTPATYTSVVTETGKDPKTYTAGIVTLCVEVRDGILSLWSKANPDKVMSLPLTDAYVGGNISLTSSSIWDSAFAGMRLKKYEPMAAGTVAVNAQTGIITVQGVENQEIQVGSFKVTDNNGTSYIPTRVGFRYADELSVYRVLDDAGNVVTNFEAEDVQITFAENTLAAPNIANYGFSVNLEKSGLRFISRFNRVKDTAGKEYFVTGDGTQYEIVDYGMLMAAQPGLDTTQADTNEDLTVNTANRYVQKISIKERNVYYDYCNAFNDMAVTIINIEQNSAENISFYARPYVIVKVGEGEQVLYGDYSTSTYAAAVAQ